MKEVVKLYRTPKEIVLDWDSKFTSNFWKGLFKEFGTKFNLNTTYQPQTDGNTDWVNQVIEDMLIMYVMERSIK